MGISTVTGQFNDFEGSINYDEKNLENSSAEATIKASSIDTENKKRDDHLRSPDFFNAQKNPSLSFKSTKVTPKKDGNFTLEGELTMNGVTLPVALDATMNGKVKDPWGNERIGVSAEAKLDRKDFGLTWSKLLDNGGLVVGNEVTVLLEIEGVKEKA